MRYRVRILPSVYDELLEILTYIATDSGSAARKLVDQILLAIRALSDGKVRHSCVRPARKSKLSVHRMIVQGYLVYYRVDEAHSSIVVLTVRHGARRQPRRFD